MNEFLKKMVGLADELNKADRFECVVVVNEMEKLYEQHISELKQEVKVTDRLLKGRQTLLDAIPECPVHGECVPWAVEWVEKMKKFRTEFLKERGVEEECWYVAVQNQLSLEVLGVFSTKELAEEFGSKVHKIREIQMGEMVTYYKCPFNPKIEE